VDRMQGNKLETTDTSGSFPQAGLFAIRARRRICEEGDYLKAVEKWVRPMLRVFSDILLIDFAVSRSSTRARNSRRPPSTPLTVSTVCSRKRLLASLTCFLHAD
jgi:hypothetical protein